MSLQNQNNPIKVSHLSLESVDVCFDIFKDKKKSTDETIPMKVK